MTNSEAASNDLENRAHGIVGSLRQRAIPGSDTLEGAAADIIHEYINALDECRLKQTNTIDDELFNLRQHLAVEAIRAGKMASEETDFTRSKTLNVMMKELNALVLVVDGLRGMATDTVWRTANLDVDPPQSGVVLWGPRG